MIENWIIALISFAIIFLGSYLLLYSIIENFIYRKIKLIYKFIHQTKASKKEEMYYKYILPQKSMDDVREDVEAWAEQRSREIELLKKNEVFRKEFLQNLSHEFKTPVFTIQGYVDTLLNGAMENPEINKKFLEKTAKNVERLVNLIIGMFTKRLNENLMRETFTGTHLQLLWFDFSLLLNHLSATP